MTTTEPQAPIVWAWNLDRLLQIEEAALHDFYHRLDHYFSQDEDEEDAEFQARMDSFDRLLDAHFAVSEHFEAEPK